MKLEAISCKQLFTCKAKKKKDEDVGEGYARNEGRWIKLSDTQLPSEDQACSSRSPQTFLKAVISLDISHGQISHYRVGTWSVDGWLGRTDRVLQ